MKLRKNLLATQIAAGAMAATAFGMSSSAVADTGVPGLDLDAGVEISNMYLYRGVDLGAPAGLALVAGWLEASHDSGLYVGTWAASGDGEGTEIDLYAGYGIDLTEDISLDLNVTTFMFPKQDKGEDHTGFGDFSEVGLGLSAFGADFSYYNNIAGDSGYQYYSLGYGVGPFYALVGVNDFDSDNPSDLGEDFTHVDLTYAFNDNLSFTASTIVDADEDEGLRRSTLLEVMYTQDFSL